MAFIVSMMATAHLCGQDIVRVDGDDGSANPAGEGDDWGSDAYKYLQDALTKADELLDEEAEEVQIWVAATGASNPYRPDRDANNQSGSGDPEASFVLRDAVGLYGGFVGDETTLEDRDPAENETVLSGDVRGSDESYNVVSAPDVDSTALLDGFTVTGGDADHSSDGDFRRGGGIRVGESFDGASPRIYNCIIELNSAEDHGGGISIDDLGASDDSDVEIRNCTIRDNDCVDGGGGVSSSQSTARIVNCGITGNDATDSSSTGGGVRSSSGLVKVVCCEITDNEAGLWGGGIAIIGSASGSGTVTCTLIAENEASSGGDGIFVDKASAEIVNCTIAYNDPVGSGTGGGYADDNHSTTVTIENSILWENGGTSEADQIVQLNAGTLTVDFSDVQGGWTGDGDDNINSDPDFVEQSAGNYRLMMNSPCVDAGDFTLVPDDSEDADEDDDETEETPDLDLNTRVLEDDVDMGAYEWLAVDTNGDGCVNVDDLVNVVLDWDTDGSANGGDVDGSGLVDVDDLVWVILNWDLDGCSSASLESEVEDSGLTYPADWEEFMDNIDDENYRCWMEHYLTSSCHPTCTNPPNCPDDDPWDNH